jgi:hypothetical protein
VDTSINYLNMAIEKGYSNWDLIETDRDLDNVRGSARYKKILEKINKLR